MESSLFRAWYFSSDEYVIVSEVVRFIRVDSLSMCFILASVLALLRGLKREEGSAWPATSEIRWILLSGFLAGLGAATRFHSITASLPILLLFILFSKAPTAYPAWLI